MSICISKHGEYSSHHEPTPDDPFTCVLCGQLDKEGLLTTLAERDAEVERLRAEVRLLRRQHQGQGAHIVALRTELDRLTAPVRKALDGQAGR